MDYIYMPVAKGPKEVVRSGKGTKKSKTMFDLSQKLLTLDGVGIIEVEAEITGSSMAEISRAKKRYRDLISTIVHVLVSDESSGGFGWRETPQSETELYTLIRETLSLVWSEFEAAPGVRTFVDAFRTGRLDCDTSTIILHDVLKQFGVRSNFVYLLGQRRFGSHVILKVEDKYVDPASLWGVTGSRIPIYSEEELKNEHTVLGINKDPLSLAYHNVGLAKAMHGHFEQAIKYYEKAIELDSKNAFYYTSCAFARFQVGDVEGALSDVNKALEICPAYSDAYYVRSIVRRALGDYIGAREDLRMSR